MRLQGFYSDAKNVLSRLPSRGIAEPLETLKPRLPKILMYSLLFAPVTRKIISTSTKARSRSSVEDSLPLVYTFM